RDIPLDELAALAAMDKFRLLRAFSAEVGFPPHAYQLLVRIYHARRLLSAGESAAKVAVQVGFSDQSHLIRQFRRVEGMTPAAYLRGQRPSQGLEVVSEPFARPEVDAKSLGAPGEVHRRVGSRLAVQHYPDPETSRVSEVLKERFAGLAVPRNVHRGPGE